MSTSFSGAQSVLAPGARIGILGGGQLGRMLAIAGARLGFDVHIYTPEDNAPASRVAAQTVKGAYEDLDAVRAFARGVDVVTYEFENVPVETAAAAAECAPVRPGARALEVAQDRLVEKSFLNDAAIATVAFRAVECVSDLERAIAALGVPSILKTRRFGYDGKGQARLKAGSSAEAAFAEIGAQSAILEGFAAFEREVSIVAARGLDGAVKAYPLAENEHEGGILRRSIAPTQAQASLGAKAEAIATTILTQLDYVGVLAVEFFVLAGDQLLVNEIAPRVHNTGHWTMDACACDQFEQHMRAVAGWPLGDPTPHSAGEMINLIGEDAADWLSLAQEPQAVLHLYGKNEIRAGRKMGHLNRLKPLRD